MNPVFPLESQAVNYSLGEVLHSKEDLKDDSLLKMFENKVFGNFKLSSAPITWTAEQVIIVKKEEQKQFKHLIEFIITSLDKGNCKQEIDSLKNLLEESNLLLVGVNVLDLKSSISQNKEILLGLIKNLSIEDLDSLQNTYFSDSILLNKIFKEAKYIKKLEHINLTCSSPFDKKQEISPLLHSIRQSEDVPFLLQCINRLPKDLKIHYLHEICRPYTEDISISLPKYSLTERDIVSALTSSSFNQQETDQVLTVLSQVLIDKGQIKRALTILFMITDSELRTHLLETSIDLSLYQQFTEEDLIKKASALYRSDNSQFDLTVKLMKESPHLENKNILALLIISEINDPYYNLLIDQVCHYVLMNSCPELASTIDKIVFTALPEISGLLKACSADARSDLIQLLSLMPQTGKDTNLPLLLHPISGQFASFEKIHKLEVSTIKRLLINISNEKIIKEVLELIKNTPSEDRLNLLKTMCLSLEDIELKEEAFISLLKIPPRFWPTSEHLKSILDKKQLFTDIANSIEHDGHNNLSDRIDLRLKSSGMGENTWYHYVVRNKNFEVEKEYNNTLDNDNQKNYGRIMHQVIWATTHYIIKEKAAFGQIFDFVCLQRNFIAKKLGHTPKEEFGKTRTLPYTTTCVSLYEELGRDLKKINKMLLNGRIKSDNIIRELGYRPQEATIDKMKNTLTPSQVNSNDSQPDSDFIFKKTALIGEDKVELSTLKHAFKNVLVYHTPEKNIPKIMSYIEKLYTNLLNIEIKSSEDKARVLEMSGEFYWWFCECKPVERGDPSIAEIMLRAVWNLKGIDSLPWKKEIIPWAEVVKALDVHEFAKNFHHLLDHESL